MIVIRLSFIYSNLQYLLLKGEIVMVNENLYIQAGNLTRDPESRNLNNGGIVAVFGLASNRTWNDRQTGERKEEATFCEWEVYGPQANTVMQYLKKGMAIYCRGRARFQDWVDEATQQRRNRITFVLDRFEFQGTREQNGLPAGQAPAANNNANPNPPANQAPPAGMSSDAPAVTDDEIPF